VALGGYRSRVSELEPDDMNWLPGQIVIQVLSRAGRGVPGVRVRVEWSQGSEWVVTGLHPDRGPGYADVRALTGETYTLYVDGHPSSSVKVAAGSAPAQESWGVVFQQQ
jgi:hypothetical protein